MLIAFRNNPIHSIDYFSVRLMPGDAQSALKEMDLVLRSIDPSHLIEYNFLDDRLDNFYRQDTKTRSVVHHCSCWFPWDWHASGFFVGIIHDGTANEGNWDTKGFGCHHSSDSWQLLSSTYIKLVLAAFIIGHAFGDLGDQSMASIVRL
jgi:hypothetical protein